MSETNNREQGNMARKLRRRIDAIGWGVFFIWIGVALLADLGWGAGFIGIGVIILGGFAAREYFTGSACSRTTSVCC